MKLDRIHYFNEELAKDTMVSGAIEHFSIYYFFNDKFHSLDGLDATEDISPFLEKTRKKKGVWREPSNRRTYFFLEELDAVVVADFYQAPNTDTQKYFRLALLNCARHASNAFHAAHDKLTELLNRHSLEQELDSIISSAVSLEGADLTSQQQVAILAFDIDHFKQVNDTYGHLYGDIVLMSFARRLEAIAQQLAMESPYKERARFVVSRPGGEEFTIVENGFLTDTEVCDLARKFCEEIAIIEMPTHEEWLQYEKLGLTTGLQFPPDRERKITCSVGVISQGLPVSGTSAKLKMNNLLNRADIALYKAKTSGRNRICFFPNIVKRYGRVLEFNLETDIVVIDLGLDVGLKNGQELLVFHPKFDGTTDYVHQDGRTLKRMGSYPRLHSARIEAFEVQKEISFCRVLERIPNTAELVKDSWLEAIPLGAIDHLVKSSVGGELLSAKNTSGPLTAEIIKKKIADLGDQHPFCAVLRIANEAEAINNIGQASTNRILADIYNALQKRFSWSATIGYVQPTQFALVHLGDSTHSENMISESLSEINERYAGKVRVIAGIFNPDEIDASYWRDGKVNYSKSLELASFISLLPEIAGTSTYSKFDKDSLSALVPSLENAKGQEQTLADLRRLSEFGIQAAWFENMIGKLAFGLSDYDQALTAMREASVLDPVDPVYQANVGITYYMKNMHKEAYDVFCNTEKLNEGGIPISYLGAWAVAADWASIERADVKTEQVIALYDRALANKSKLILVDPDALSKRRDQLNEAVKMQQVS